MCKWYFTIRSRIRGAECSSDCSLPDNRDLQLPPITNLSDLEDPYCVVHTSTRRVFDYPQPLSHLYVSMISFLALHNYMLKCLRFGSIPLASRIAFLKSGSELPGDEEPSPGICYSLGEVPPPKLNHMLSMLGSRFEAFSLI